MADDVLVTLARKLPSLRPAEQRVARAVLDDPTLAVGSTVAELAEACGTSPATVVRLCVALGLSGHREFRLAAAAAVTREQTEQDRFAIRDADLDPEDSVDEVVAKVAFQEARSIEETARGLDRAALQRAADAIGAATRTDIYGQGASGLAGAALQQKLLRIGITSSCWTDSQLALMSALTLGPGTVAVGVSHSGATAEVGHTLHVAHQAGATTIAITNVPDSPIAAHADVVLTTAVREMRWWSGAMSSRVAQLAVVDVLFLLVARQRMGAAVAAATRSFEAAQRYSLPYDTRRGSAGEGVAPSE